MEALTTEVWICPRCKIAGRQKSPQRRMCIDCRKECQRQLAKKRANPPSPGSSEVDDPDLEIEGLVNRKIAENKARRIKHQEKATIVVPVGNQPIGIVHFGDPHIDDNGCNLELLARHVKLVQTFGEGVYGGNVGDSTNNWVGRLTALYADQSTTKEEALRLTEWLIHSIPWLYFLSGNHDHWNEGNTILQLLMKGSKVICRADHEANIMLRFGNGTIFRIRARHNFAGHSMWHPTHGMVRAAKQGSWGDLFVAGHTHEHGLICVEAEPGVHKWGLRVRGYKESDSYAAEKGFYENKHGHACLTIIDPYAPEPSRVATYWDVEYGLNLLQWLRHR